MPLKALVKFHEKAGVLSIISENEGVGLLEGWITFVRHEGLFMEVDSMSKLFEATEINGMKLANRFVRSATSEGMAGQGIYCVTAEKEKQKASAG